MRVLHLVKATRISGAERHLLILLTALRERDVDARLVLLVEPRNLMHDLVAEAQQRAIPVERLIIRHHADVTVARRVRALLRAQKPDILHTHLIHADLYGALATVLTGTILITSRHNDDPFRRRFPVRMLHRLLWRRARYGILISEAIRRFVIDVEGAPPHKLRVIHYGIEYTPVTPAEVYSARQAVRAELSLSADTPLLGMACRLTAQKGLADALAAFAMIHNEYPLARLVIAGDGELLASLQAQARSLGIADFVHFLGWRSDVPQLMAGLDVFLMPSHWEGFGLVLIEAMSKRLPVVASRVSAIPEVVADGETGYLVPPRSPSALAQAIRRLLHDRVLRLHMGMMAEDRLEQHFTARRMAEETLAVYEEARP